VDFTEQSPVSLSVCPGLLGIERGLKRVFPKLRTAAYVEIETFIVENILSAMEAGLVDATPVWTNLKTFNPQPFRGLIDILLGGYPCQPFSLAGNRNGINDPRHLWPYLYSIAETIKPFCCFFENVSGHLSMGYDQVYRDLRSLGYRVETGIYTASEVGAPHQRERLFILAILADTGDLGFNGRNSRNGDAGIWKMDTDKENRSNIQCKIEGCCNEMADTNCEQRGLSKPIEWRENPKVEWSCQKLASPCYDGSNEPKNQQSIVQGKGRSKTRTNELFKSQGRSCSGIDDRFPAGQGAFQYEWEEPRTIESSVEYTINGYNFTEDLHRAIGNSVVEQTAELAFRDLWNKHFPNDKI
jgi:DNA (cytosine-5)-methyltransferase 1